MKRGLLLWLFVAISVLHASAQKRTITGKVTDASDGSPLPGVTVVIKGSTAGTVTGGDGSYKIDVSGSEALVFSFVGYTQQTFPSNRSVINVGLVADNKQLGEVVVTALGVSRQKKALGYSVETIKQDELTRGANPNLATAIQGKVAGVEVRPSSGMPGASAQIFIRGARFFSDNNGPLYVIDGMPVNSNPDFVVGGSGVAGADFSGRSIDINPNDIETFTVLKGQAASALYGTRASNGVVMITTKNGKGLKKGKPVISVASNYQFDQISRLPERQNKYAQGAAGAYNIASTASWGPEIGQLPDDPKFGGNKPNKYNNNNPTAETRGKYWSWQRGEWITPGVYDSPKDFFVTGGTATNNVNVSQSLGNANYAVGLGATNQSGIVRETGMDRYNAKFGMNIDVSSKVQVGASGNFSTVDIKKLPSGNNSILFEIYGTPPNYDMKGNPTHEKLNPYKQLSYRAGFDNPYWALANNSYKENTRRFFGNTFINYEPIKGLAFRYQLGIDQYTTDMEEIIELGSAARSSIILGENPSTKAPSGGQITNRAYLNRSFNSLFQATYTKKMGEDFTLGLLLGSEIVDNLTRSIQQDGYDFSIGGWHNMTNTSTQTGGEAKFRNRTIGFFGNASLDWKSTLYLNLTGRNDKISRMPRGNRSFFYPSVSLGWVVTELPALRDKDVYAKLRVSYAEVGAPGTYRDRVYVQSSSGSGFLSNGIQYPFNGIIGYQPNSTLYDKLRPQNTKSIEFGGEINLFDNRIGLDYTYTQQTTKDQIFSVPLAGSTGFGAIFTNGGEMRNSVHELILKATPVKTKDFEWNISVNYSKVNNEVIALAPGVENIFLGGFTDPQVRAAIGTSFPAIYGTAFLRNDEGKMIIDDATGFPIKASEPKVIGNVTPDFVLGGTNTLRYKFVRLSALFEWKKGGQMYSGANRLIDLYGTSAKTAGRATDKLLLDGVKASTVKDGKGGSPNDKAIEGIPAFQNYYNVVGAISEASVYGTSFVKLREIALTVDLPKSLCDRTGFLKAATLSVSARNILLWTEYPNFDPESSQGNGNMQGGFDYMSLPQTKSLGIGLNLTL